MEGLGSSLQSREDVKTLIAGLVAAAVVLYLVKRFFEEVVKWHAWSQLPPPQDKGHPLLGNFKEWSKPGKHLTALRWTFDNPIVRVRLIHYPILIIGDPVLAESLFNVGEGSAFDKSQRVYGNIPAKSKNYHPTLFTSPTNSYWRAVRKGVSPAFNTNNLRLSFANLVQVTEHMVDHIHSLGPNQKFDADEIASRVTIDSINFAMLGKDLGATKGAGKGPVPYLEALDHYLEALMFFVSLPIRRKLKFLPAVKKHYAAVAKYATFNEALRKDIQTTPPPPTSIGAHLLKIKDPKTNAPLSDDQLQGELTSTYMAGFETSAHTIAWTLYLLSQNPEAEQKIAEELASQGLLATADNPHPRSLTWDDMGHLTYLKAAIKESMRVLPVIAIGTVRKTERAIQLGEYNIPKGLNIWVSMYAVHNNPKYWDEPEVFRPERFLEPGADNVQEPKQSAATANGHLPNGSTKTGSGSKAKRFFPFSQGMRNCVGKNLGELTVQAFMAVFCSHFTVRLAPEMGGVEGVRKRQEIMLTLRPHGGMWVHAIPRAPRS